jgi:hypothetical protein
MIPKLTSMTSLPHSLQSSIHTISGVHHGGLLHNETILLQTSHVTTRVGKRNFIDLIGVQPNLALAAFED